MYLIIVGAGAVGSSLVQLALKDGHDVALIERDEDRAKRAAACYDCMVLHADIAQGGIMEEAQAERAQALIATTDDDSDNLMAAFLGVEHGVQTLISVVNDERHQGLFQRLGVHVLLDPEQIIAEHLYGVLCQPAAEDVIKLAGGAQVVELKVAPDSPLAGKSLSQSGQARLLPKEALIVSLKRGDKTLIPSGKTVLEAQDLLTVFAQRTLGAKELEVFSGARA